MDGRRGKNEFRIASEIPLNAHHNHVEKQSETRDDQPIDGGNGDDQVANALVNMS